MSQNDPSQANPHKPSRSLEAVLNLQHIDSPRGLVDLMLEPRHALAGGALLAAEAFLHRAPLLAHRSSPLGLRHDRELCTQMGGWLLETACVEAEGWNDVAGDLQTGCYTARAVRLSVNMSARALHEGRLLAETRSAIARSGLSPVLLELGLSETAVADDETEALLELSALRDLGVGLSLADFGSVSASLRLLQRLPLTAVKLDPRLSRGVVHDRATRATVASAINLAHTLNTTVVATGVQTASQRDILADMGCDDAQGHLIGAPMTAAFFRAILTRPLDAETCRMAAC